MKFDVDAILQKADLLAYVERAGGVVKKNGARYSCACPIHGGDNTTAFSIYPDGGKIKWHCFTGSCGGGDAITFVEKWQGLDFKGACEWINGGAINDAQGMKESAERRLEQARVERVAAQEREEARRVEYRLAERHLHYHNSMKQHHRDLWTAAGIDEGMQDFWTLGGCDDFVYKHDEVLYHSPTLTIPIFNPDFELMTIQHRLINPVNPKDKYRPDITGLHSSPFLAVPSMGYDGGFILVLEGSKKAMVTWTRSNSDWQCIGVPSQGEYKKLIEILQPVGKKVIAIPDPDTAQNQRAFKSAYELTHAIGGKVVRLKDKIDDLIIAAQLQENDLNAILQQARRL